MYQVKNIVDFELILVYWTMENFYKLLLCNFGGICCDTFKNFQYNFWKKSYIPYRVDDMEHENWVFNRNMHTQHCVHDSSLYFNFHFTFRIQFFNLTFNFGIRNSWYHRSCLLYVFTANSTLNELNIRKDMNWGNNASVHSYFKVIEFIYISEMCTCVWYTCKRNNAKKL